MVSSTLRVDRSPLAQIQRRTRVWQAQDRVNEGEKNWEEDGEEGCAPGPRTRSLGRNAPAGRELRDALEAAARDLDADARLAASLCVADIGAVNATVAELQWRRNKAALALYHRTVASLCRRAAARVAGGRVETARPRASDRIDVHRDGLDERAVARLARCDATTLERVKRTAASLRAQWLNASRAAWNANRPRRAAELRTASVYAYHIARWAHAAREARPTPSGAVRTSPRRSREPLEGRDGHA